MNFKDLGLSEETIRAIDEFGIVEPTSVQSDVIPSILQGRDIFTIAPARCGKTMSYVLPLLDIINAKKAKNILIVAANSQASVTISDNLAIFNKYHEINSAAIQDSQENIANEANVIIGAPDLLIDVVNNDKVDLSKVDILVVDDMKDAIDVTNEIASEHLEIVTKNPFETMTKIRNAGAIFLGEYSSEPLGDYFAGPNHILPTNGTAKFFGPLSVDDFVKKSSIIYYSREALEPIHKDIIKFAASEQLTAHANSIKVRFEEEV